MKVLSRFGFCAAVAATIVAMAPAANAESKQSPAAAYSRQFGYIAVRDGTRLAYVAYLPVTKAKFPTILDYDPYAGAGTGNERFPQGGLPPSVQWLNAGYAFVYVSVRGTGCSQGVLDWHGENEGPDGADVVDWIGRQPWSNQRVGMIGGSYPGHTQIMVAAQHPKWLRAIAPSAITMSSYDDNARPGGIFNLGKSSRWSLMVQPGAEMYGARARMEWGDKECQANMAAHPAPNQLAQFSAHPLRDDWWETRSLSHYVDRVEVPTFIGQSWQDHETSVTGATEVYAHLKAPKWLTLTSGGHDWPSIVPDVQARLVRWMDHWVKGVANGAETEPPVKIYWEIGPERPFVAKWTSEYAAWPVPEARPKTLYLTSEGALNEVAPANNLPASSRSYTFGLGVELIGDKTQFSLEPDPTGTLSWSSDAFTQDVTVLGAPQVHLFVSSENIDTDFVVTLHDVYPNGDVQYLQRGVLRASMRRVDETKSTPEHVYHPYDRSEPLSPGQVYEVRLSLPPVGAVLRKGHRLELTVTSPSAIPQPEWGLQPLNLPGRNTVYSSNIYPSRVVIPIVPGAMARAAEPACGSMPFQPCRRAAKP
jgi:predicted acyl esterase